MAVDIHEDEPAPSRIVCCSSATAPLLKACDRRLAVDIRTGHIYLRDEYHGCREMLANEIESLLLELPIAGLPPIHLRRSCRGTYLRRESR